MSLKIDPIQVHSDKIGERVIAEGLSYDANDRKAIA